MTVVQQQLLQRAVDLVRPGGRVVYSVCTWTSDEADDVVAHAVDGGRVTVAGVPQVGTPTRFGVQMAPDRDEGDGMYMAVLERTAEVS